MARKSYKWTRERELALLDVMRGQGEKNKWSLILEKYRRCAHGGKPPASLKKETLKGKWYGMRKINSVVQSAPSPDLPTAVVRSSPSPPSAPPTAVVQSAPPPPPDLPTAAIGTNESASELKERESEAPVVTAQLSEYEVQRLQRMQANRAKLLELGILLEKPAPVKREPKPIKSTRPSRRSLRVRGLDPRPMAPVVIKKPRVIKPKEKLKRPENLEELLLTKSLSISSIFLPLKLERFHDQWLHRQIWPKGKRTVVKAMCPDHNPLFTETSGFVRWSNATVLFVDMPKEPSDEEEDELPSYYDNVFEQQTLDDQSVVFFRWFASSKLTEQSPTIVRLLQAERGAPQLRLSGSAELQSESRNDDKAETMVTDSSPLSGGVASTQAPPLPVLLFLRHHKGPYIYCGRLAYLGHLPEARRKEFRWQLLDMDGTQWKQIQSLVQAEGKLVDTASVKPAAKATRRKTFRP